MITVAERLGKDTLRKHGIVACASDYERHGDSSERVMTVVEAMQ
ncbi:DNA-directed DNA polymerase [Pseudomonas putida]|nr:DNA-directed DNA polymerase [Pseudomonas putida]